MFMKIDPEFYHLLQSIVHSEDFKKMKTLRHHIKTSAYAHSIKVAYLCYQHHKRHGTRIDRYFFVRGALLHDYYLYDRRNKSIRHKFHSFTHPKKALQNAKNAFPDLTPMEIDMIERHMFPLTPHPPKTRGGWLLCFYDKVAAISDLFGKNMWKNEKRRG